MMKRNIFYILLGTLFLASCQQEKVPSSNEGYLVVSGLTVETESLEIVSTRSEDVSQPLTIEIWKGEELLDTRTEAELTDKIKLEVGADYLLKVYSPNYLTDVEWTNKEKGEPVYYWEQSFEVKAEETTALNVEVPMVNYGVQLSLPEGFTEIFPRYTFSVRAGDRIVGLQNGEIVYFPHDAKKHVTYSLQTTNVDQESNEATGSYGDESGESGKMIVSGTVYVITYSMEYNALKVSL